jgi:chromosomal replication initiation ATPase DnaA
MGLLGELQRVCEVAWGLPAGGLKQRNRRIDYVYARMTFAYVARELGYPLAYIGKHLRRHHSTVINALSKYEPELRTNSLFAEKLEEVYNAMC